MIGGYGGHFGITWFKPLWKGLERKDTLWKSECDHREQDISERELQLATQEAALTRKAEALDLRKLELER